MLILLPLYPFVESYLADDGLDLLLGGLDRLGVTLDVNVDHLLLGIQVILVESGGFEGGLALLATGNGDLDTSLGLDGTQGATLGSKKMRASRRGDGVLDSFLK